MKMILLFFDGVGLAPAGPNNPFSQELPFISSIIGGPLIAESAQSGAGLIFSGLDACLGVEGMPQSATGQTALFTGINAPEKIGYHHPAFPGAELRDLIAEHALLKQAEEAGFRSTFANAYTPYYFDLVESGKRKHSVTTLSVYAAGQSFRSVEDYKAGRAVYWDFSGRHIHQHESFGIQPLSPGEAGRRIAGLSADFDLVIFENFMPDLIGHKGNAARAAEFIDEMDTFFRGLVEALDGDTSVILTSDHGNMEDLGLKGHTRNPAMLFVLGPAAEYFASAARLTDITPAILAALAASPE